MTDDLARLREAASRGDRDAEDQLVELAGERGDLDGASWKRRAR